MSKKSHARAPDKTGFSVALPTALVAQIEHVASVEHRSRNHQIEHFLHDAVARWKRDHPIPAPKLYDFPEPNLESDIAAEPPPAPYGVKADAAGKVLRARAGGKAPPPIAQEPPRPAPAKDTP